MGRHPVVAAVDTLAELLRGLADDAAFRDVAAWLTSETRTDPRNNRRSQRLAASLGTKWSRLARALAEGAVNAEQAAVIATALDRLPDAAADRLLTYLHAFTSPRHEGARPVGERLPHEVHLGQAFCSLLETLDPKRLPVHGGDATTVVVTVDLQTLRDGLGTATIGSDSPITAAEARRLACTARVLPMVLGGESEVLDLGRSRRLFSPAQRKAMVVRDRHCRAQGCDIPAACCEAHHAAAPWAQSGQTDLAEGRLLCAWHHDRAHDDRYLHSLLPNGDVRFHRRRKADPTGSDSPSGAGRSYPVPTGVRAVISGEPPEEQPARAH